MGLRVRKKKNQSGSISVQIVDRTNRGYKVVETLILPLWFFFFLTLKPIINFNKLWLGTHKRKLNNINKALS